MLSDQTVDRFGVLKYDSKYYKSFSTVFTVFNAFEFRVYSPEMCFAVSDLQIGKILLTEAEICAQVLQSNRTYGRNHFPACGL